MVGPFNLRGPERRSRGGEEALARYAQTERQARLQAFLRQQGLAGQWETSIAALRSAVGDGVWVSSTAIANAIVACGAARQFPTARKLFYDFHRQLGLSRSLAAHRAIMSAAAAGGQWRFALGHMVWLASALGKPQRRDLEAEPTTADAKNSLGTAEEEAVASRSPTALTPELVNSMLHSVVAAAASAAASRSASASASASQPSSLPPQAMPMWEASLRTYFLLRGRRGGPSPVPGAARPERMSIAQIDQNTVVALASLTRATGRWQASLALLASCFAEGREVVPEAYDHVVAACFAADRHQAVTGLVSGMVAARVPPHEATVRMAMFSCEEVCATEASNTTGLTLLSTPAASPMAPTAFADGSSSLSPSWALSCMLFQALASQGLPLVPQTYATPLRACALAGRWAEAASMLGEMRIDRQPLDPSLVDLVVCAKVRSASSYDEAAAIASRLSLWREASPTSGTTHNGRSASPPRSRPRVPAQTTSEFNALISVALRNGEFGRCFWLKRHMRDASIPANEESRALFLLCHAASGHWEAAIDAFVSWHAHFQREHDIAERGGYLSHRRGTNRFLVGSSVRTALRAVCDRLGGRSDARCRTVLDALSKMEAPGSANATSDPAPPLALEASKPSASKPNR